MKHKLTRLRLRLARSATDLPGQPLGPWPIVAGWDAKAKAAMAGCCLAALVGMLSVVWWVALVFPSSSFAKPLFISPLRVRRYSWGALNENEIEAEEQRRHEQKMAKKAAGQHSGLRGLVGKVSMKN